MKIVGFFIFLLEVDLASINDRIEEIVRPTVEGMGFELWGVEFRHQGRHSYLTVYIDSEEGVTIDDCSDVSRQLSSVLDVEDVITYAYDLEVSSPGMDRILFTLDQCRKYVGSEVNFELNIAVGSYRKFKAVLEKIEDTVLTLRTKTGEEVEVLYSNIKRARLVPDFSINKDVKDGQ